VLLRVCTKNIWHCEIRTGPVPCFMKISGSRTIASFVRQAAVQFLCFQVHLKASVAPWLFGCLRWLCSQFLTVPTKGDIQHEGVAIKELSIKEVFAPGNTSRSAALVGQSNAQNPDSILRAKIRCQCALAINDPWGTTEERTLAMSFRVRVYRMQGLSRCLYILVITGTKSADDPHAQSNRS
jgi:hypothetical protein